MPDFQPRLEPINSMVLRLSLPNLPIDGILIGTEIRTFASCPRTAKTSQWPWMDSQVSYGNSSFPDQDRDRSMPPIPSNKESTASEIED